MGMIRSLLFSDRAPEVAKRGISLNAEKAAVSATNISNAETPGYKAQKFEFESVLQSAVSGNTLPMKGTNPMHMSGTNGPDVKSVTGIREADTAPGRIDGNNVDLDREVVDFAQTQMSYNAIITAYTGRFTTMKSAITDAK